jgi:hypothetical protein
MTPPVVVTQHRNGGLAGARKILLANQAAERRSHAQHLEVVPGHERAAAAQRLLTVADVGLEAVVANTPAWVRAAYAACYTASIWYRTFGIVGAGLAFFSAPSRLTRWPR